MMVIAPFICCEVEQEAEVQATGTVEQVDVICGVCGQLDTVEVDTTDYN